MIYEEADVERQVPLAPLFLAADDDWPVALLRTDVVDALRVDVSAESALTFHLGDDGRCEGVSFSGKTTADERTRIIERILLAWRDAGCFKELASWRDERMCVRPSARR